MTALSVSPRVALRLARWLLWWWIVHTWCGAKHALWNWAITRVFRGEEE
jgi:hypothetical protein